VGCPILCSFLKARHNHSNHFAGISFDSLIPVLSHFCKFDPKLDCYEHHQEVASEDPHLLLLCALIRLLEPLYNFKVLHHPDQRPELPFFLQDSVALLFLSDSLLLEHVPLD
jgi:hypothetical protein